MVRVRYRYRVARNVVRAAITVTELCRLRALRLAGTARSSRSRSSRRRDRRRLLAQVVLDSTARVARNAIEGYGGDRSCVWAGSDPRRQTGQCDDPERETARFEGRRRRALNVRMTAVGALWQSGRGLDGWAPRRRARRVCRRRTHSSTACGGAARPARRQTGSCAGGSSAAGRERAALRRGERMFPAWEGGRGFGDCEPLARASARAASRGPSSRPTGSISLRRSTVFLTHAGAGTQSEFSSQTIRSPSSVSQGRRGRSSASAARSDRPDRPWRSPVPPRRARARMRVTISSTWPANP